MATAKQMHNVETVEKVVYEKVDVVTITLTLTQDEADLLRGVVGNISGGRASSSTKSRSRRELLDEIWNALAGAGAKKIPNPFTQNPRLED